MNIVPYRVSVGIFANNQDISPEPSVIQKIYTDLFTFNVLPGSISEIETMRGQLVNRLKFNTADNRLNIIFGMNRVDIEFAVTPSGSPLDVQECLDETRKILTAIDHNFPRVANRLSFVTNYAISPVGKTEMDNFFKKHFQDIDVLPDLKPNDWAYRTTYRDVIKFEERVEDVNKIQHLQRVKGIELKAGNIQSEFDRLDLSIDINTAQEALTYRFRLKDSIAFYQVVENAQKEFLEKILSIFQLN